MKNIVFIIAIYQRHDLTKIVLDYYRKLSKKYGFKIVVAGSEGRISKDLAKGLIYIETPNEPLTSKNNAMMQKAKEFNPDAVVLLGSDDLICENVIRWYYELNTDKVMGFADIYFYSTEHKITSYLHLDKHFGAGRYYPKTVLDKCNWNAWSGKLNKGCDNNSEKYLRSLGVEFERIELNKINGFLIDIKHDYNISNKNIIFVGNQINNNIMAKKLNKEVATKVENLTFTPKAVKSDKVKFVGNGNEATLGTRTMFIDIKKAEVFVKKGWGEICE
tara:strand:- start:5 stop:829 length:825 start_codon:yes stop_codon:yes gene_type:complete